MFKKNNTIILNSTEINKLKRQPPDENGYMLANYVEEKFVEGKERDQTQVSYG